MRKDVEGKGKREEVKGGWIRGETKEIGGKKRESLKLNSRQLYGRLSESYWGGRCLGMKVRDAGEGRGGWRKVKNETKKSRVQMTGKKEEEKELRGEKFIGRRRERWDRGVKKGGTEEFLALAQTQKNKQNTNSGPQGFIHLKLLNMFTLKMSRSGVTSGILWLCLHISVWCLNGTRKMNAPLLATEQPIRSEIWMFKNWTAVTSKW